MSTPTALLEMTPQFPLGYPHQMPSTEPVIVDGLDADFTNGDPTALRRAYDAHGSLIYSFCLRSVADDRAKDITQEVFLSAWRAHDRFDSTKGTLPGWLMGIAKHRVIDNIRAEQRHASRRSSSELTDVAVDSEVHNVADRMLVADALKTLPERSRAVIELAYLGDLTHAQIAERTSLPLGTIKSDIRRGLATIRRHLENSHD